MSKDLSTKCYQDNKERLQKKPVKDIKVFLLKEKKATIWSCTIHKSTRR